jgi:putative flippase GtrA
MVLDRVGQVVAWSKTHQGRKLIRFTCVSCVSTATSQLLILLLYGVLHVWGVIVSTFVANLCATIPSYYLNRTWTWGKRGRSHLFKEIVPFWMMSALGIVTSFFFSLWAKHLVNTHHTWPHWAHTLIVMAVNFLSFAFFWVLKLLVFNRIFHVVPDELEEVEEHLVHEEEAELSPGS